MTRVSRKWVLVLLVLLVWVAGEVGLEAYKANKFVATVNPGPGFSVATNLFSLSASSPSSPATHTSRISNTNTHLRLTRVIDAPPPELIAR